MAKIRYKISELDATDLISNPSNYQVIMERIRNKEREKQKKLNFLTKRTHKSKVMIQNDNTVPKKGYYIIDDGGTGSLYIDGTKQPNNLSAANAASVSSPTLDNTKDSSLTPTTNGLSYNKGGDKIYAEIDDDHPAKTSSPASQFVGKNGNTPPPIPAGPRPSSLSASTTNSSNSTVSPSSSEYEVLQGVKSPVSIDSQEELYMKMGTQNSPIYGNQQDSNTSSVIAKKPEEELYMQMQDGTIYDSMEGINTPDTKIKRYGELLELYNKDKLESSTPEIKQEFQEAKESIRELKHKENEVDKYIYDALASQGKSGEGWHRVFEEDIQLDVPPPLPLRESKPVYKTYQNLQDVPGGPELEKENSPVYENKHNLREYEEGPPLPPKIGKRVSQEALYVNSSFTANNSASIAGVDHYDVLPSHVLQKAAAAAQNVRYSTMVKETPSKPERPTSAKPSRSLQEVGQKVDPIPDATLAKGNALQSPTGGVRPSIKMRKYNNF